ncbi:hypothetical protein ABTZ03_09755 [Kitasatospora sp. NPDC096077]|uniref:hypothetical protein n=1 Tax=Kitasatospora sp. NPDC096077 TaxID=3155544 RepID=UPI00331CD4F3
MAEKVYSIIEVAREDGKWVYSDINFSAERAPGPPEAGDGAAKSVWHRVSPLPIAGSGLTAVGSAVGSAAGPASDDRRVYYQDPDRGVVEAVHEASSPDGRWAGYRVLSTETGAPAADVGSALAVVGQLGGLRVCYFDGGRRLVRLAERGAEPDAERNGEGTGAEWTYAVCVDAPRASPISPLAAVVTEWGEYAYYLDVRGRLVEASWLGAEGWSVSEPTSGVEGCPTPSPLTGLTATGYGTDARLVYFLDERNRPVQLEHTVVEGAKKNPEGGARWQVCDLSAYGAPAAAAGSRPAVLLTSDGHPRLHYLDADRMAVEVGFNGRGWEVDHAGAEADDGAGAPAAAAGSPLAAVAEADRSASRVYYLGAAETGAAGVPDAPSDVLSVGDPSVGDRNLIELRGAGGTWTSRNLGAELDLPDVATGVPSPFAAIRTDGPRLYYTSEE